MAYNKYPYTDFHEMNQDYILKKIAEFREELRTIKDGVYEEVMADVQPQIDSVVADFNALSGSFDTFKLEIRNSQAVFEQTVNNEIASLENEFTLVKDQLAVQLAQVKLYSDIQDENLYQRIVDDITSGRIVPGLVKVINYITGELMTVQEMFDYLCTFHLTNPITYTQLALKAKTYNEIAALNLTYTDIIVNGNVLIS